MSDYKTILGLFAITIGITSYIIYFRQIFSGKIKPHAFSWFLWGLMTAITFTAQVTRQAGSGAWATGLTALACFFISGLAFLKGSRVFAKLDWVFLSSALLAIVLWMLTNNPTLAIILVTIGDALGMLITLRKSYFKPHEESATLFFLSTLKWIPSVFALKSFTLTTWLYPVSVIFTNTLIVMVILIRRKQFKKYISNPAADFNQ